MTGIVNSTGARSGIIGTIVGTPSGGPSYEEGTFTPSVLAASSNPTCSYSAVRLGQYIKVGNMYLVMARVILTAKTGGSGRIEVNLPSTPLDVTADYNGVTRCGGFDALQKPNYCSPVRNSARVMFAHFDNADARGAAWTSDTDISEVTTSGDIQFTVIYHAQ